MESIKTRLIAFFGLTLLISSLILGSLIVVESRGAIVNESEKGLESLAAESGKFVFEKITHTQDILKNISITDNIRSMDFERQQGEILKRVESKTFLPSTGIKDMSITYRDGTTRLSNGETIKLDKFDYLEEAFKGKITRSKFFYDRRTNEVMIAYAAPIVVEDQVTALLTAISPASYYRDMIKDVTIGESGYAYLINEEGTLIAHRDGDMSRRNIFEDEKEDPSFSKQARYIEKVLQEDRGTGRYKYKGKNYYSGFAKVSDTGLHVVVAVHAGEVIAPVWKLVKNSILILILISIVAMIITYFSASIYTEPIIMIKDVVEEVSNYNLNVKVDKKILSRKDEIGVLGHSIEKVLENLNSLVYKLNEVIVKAHGTSSEMAQITEESVASINEVTNAIEEVANATGQQAMDTEQGTLKAFELERAVISNKKSIGEINNSSYLISDLVGDGLKDMNELMEGTEETNRATFDIKNVIDATKISSDKIIESSKVVRNIADQTNLLALNATIEAARAGDAGRGFAVVADEIRKLAEESKNSSNYIEVLIKDLHANTVNAVERVDTIAEIVQQQTFNVISSKEKYENIENNIKGNKDILESLNQSFQEIELMKNEILTVLESLSAISEENSAATEEVTASMEEQSASMTEISKTSDILADLSDELQDIVKKIKI